MRYAVLSDIHANIEALGAVLRAADETGVDATLCLGDLVGGYANPNEVLDLLRARPAFRCVAGNHDWMAIGKTPASGLVDGSSEGSDWTGRELTPDHRQFLASLPVFDEIEDQFSMVHAALLPVPNNQVYLYSPERISNNLRALNSQKYGAKLVFFGHTHHPVIHCLRPTGRGDAELVSTSPAEELLVPGCSYLVNPGSVGQPRDGDGRASFLIYDDVRRAIRFYRVPYDRVSAARKGQLVQLAEQQMLFERVRKQWEAKKQIRAAVRFSGSDGPQKTGGGGDS